MNPPTPPPTEPCAIGVRLRLRLWSRVRAAARDAFEVYRAPDRESAAIRAAHLGAVLRLTPQMMAANLINGALVMWAYRDAVPAGLAYWVACLWALAAFTLGGFWRQRGAARTLASPRSIRRATLHATVLASIWGVLPAAWFASSTAAQQLLLGTLVTGMLGAGAFALSPLLAASLAYVAVFTVANLVALWRTGEPLFLLVAYLQLSYSIVVALGVMAWARKSTALLRAQRDAARQGQIVTALLQDFEDHADEALWEIDRDGFLTHVSPRLAELLALPGGEPLRQPLLALLRQRSTAAAASLAEMLNRNQAFRGLRLALPDGDGLRWWTVSAKPLIDEGLHAGGWRGVLADVTEQTLSHQRLEQMAHFDSLTGLHNRPSMHAALADALQRQQSAALISVDLDHFKAINDSLGHAAGDAVLREVSQRLRSSVRPGDVVARLGGDEFAVLLLPMVRSDEELGQARRIGQALRLPIAIGNRSVRVGASLGVVWLPTDGRSVDELLLHADLALYEAKHAGRGRHAVFDPAMGERSRRRVAIEQGLRGACERGEFSLNWQPLVDIASWRIGGAEVLLRWDSPTLGAVGPAEFIPLAEQTGLIVDIGRWVLQQACDIAASELAGLDISVNVSPAQLRDVEFGTHVQQALHSSGLDPDRLQLEITESIFLDDVQGAMDQLHGIRALGVRIALDDFGTGYSSLAYMRRFPFDTLKIDRAFVNELILRADTRAIVRMIAELGTTLGMRTVAEGVETVPQLAQVAAAGCHVMQGYLASPPCTTGRFVQLRSTWSTNSPLVPVVA